MYFTRYLTETPSKAGVYTLQSHLQPASTISNQQQLFIIVYIIDKMQVITQERYMHSFH